MMKPMAALMFCLMVCCGCASAGGGQGGAAFTMDVESFGEKLYKELQYRDQLEELDPVIVYTLLGIAPEDVAAQKNYFSSGATAEEIIVFKAVDQKAADALKLTIENRIEYQKEIYASYAPEEVNYLKGAVLEQKGEYVVYCVAEDSAAAKSMIEKALKNP